MMIIVAYVLTLTSLGRGLTKVYSLSEFGQAATALGFRSGLKAPGGRSVGQRVSWPRFGEVFTDLEPGEAGLEIGKVARETFSSPSGLTGSKPAW